MKRTASPGPRKSLCTLSPQPSLPVNARNGSSSTTNLRSVPTSSSPRRRRTEVLTALKGKEEPRRPIRIFHPPDRRHVSHPVNVTIRLINEFRSLCFGHTRDLDRARLIRIGGELRLALSEKFVCNPEEYVKDYMNVIELKCILLRALYDCLNKSNGAVPWKVPGGQQYFYNVSNGQHTDVVMDAFKQRPWLKEIDRAAAADIIWTQWHVPDMFALIPAADPKANSASHSAPTFQFGRIYNHIEGSEQIGQKKNLFYNTVVYYKLMHRDPFLAIPRTYHIVRGEEDPVLDLFHAYFIAADEAIRVAKNEGHDSGERNVWIVKPGEDSNRGFGIRACKSVKEIREAISGGSGQHTYIIQKYIERPLLVDQRKFDIRCFGLMTAVNGRIKGYFYKDGYLRTSAKLFSLSDLGDQVVHLTNETVQVRSPDFGKFEHGNKLSYADLQEKILRQHKTVTVDVNRELVTQIKQLVTENMRSVHGLLDPHRRTRGFELLGYDLMIDADFHIYLIEANVNSCMVMRSPITSTIIPEMLDNTLRIAIDPAFQPSVDDPLCYFSQTGIGNVELLPEIKYELVYDSELDGKELDAILAGAGQVDIY